MKTVVRFLALLCICLLCACQTQLYADLSEEQANEMLAVLLKRGIEADKVSMGKKGFMIEVSDRQIVRALQVLHEHGLPRGTYASLGTVFSGGGMISSAGEEQARMTHALSQELANTFSNIDGVLTARVHVVLAVNDPLNNVKLPAQATVFLRHTPDSIVTTLVPDIRKACAGAVAGLEYDRVVVMLVPARTSVTVPDAPPPPPSLLDGRFSWPLLLQTLALALLFAGTGIAGTIVVRRIMAGRGQAREEKDQAGQAGGRA